MATELDPRWYKAWHSWALCNFEAIAHLESLDAGGDSKCSDAMLQHILSAIEGELLIVCMNPSEIVSRVLPLYFSTRRQHFTGLAPSLDALV